MLDIQFIRANPESVAEKSKQKGYEVDIQQLLGFDKERRELTAQTDDLRRQRKELAAQQSGQKPSDEQITTGKKIKDQLTNLEHKLASIEKEYEELLKQVPNMPLDGVPVGASEAENKVVKTAGEPTKFDFKPKNHAELAETKGWLDKERAAKVAGSRFAYLKGDLVQLQFAIIQFVLAKLTDSAFLDEVIKENNLDISNKPFLPVLPPYLLRTDIYDAMDRLEPRDDRYKIDGEELWLQGSAEHVLGSMHYNEIIDKSELPLRYVGYATSFRREAGNYGKDTEGIFRMHQFDKLEMESLTTPEQGLGEHLFLVAIQERFMQLLGIPYQLLEKCTADIGKPNAKGVDINAWLPGQEQYRETHTADYMTDYQTRRLKTRLKSDDGLALLHSNDATAFALGRTMIAVIENFQTKAGDIKIPEVLRPFMGGKSEI